MEARRPHIEGSPTNVATEGWMTTLLELLFVVCDGSIFYAFLELICCMFSSYIMSH